MRGDLRAIRNIRITHEQDVYLSSRCELFGITCSEYIRKLIEQDRGTEDISKMQTKDNYLAKKELIKEINYIGHNINQITRNVNSNYYSEYEKKKLFALMDKLNKLVAENVSQF